MKFRFSAILIFTALSIRAGAVGLVITNNYVVSPDQTVPTETWVFSGSASPDGTFENDLLIGSAEALTLEGTYMGNLWGGASLLQSDVNLNGVCERNVRLAGLNVRVNGTIKGNLAVFALNSIMIGTNAVIEGDIQLNGVSTIVQEGRIGGSADISSKQRITLAGTIQGDARVVAPEVVLPDNARIGGSLTYLSLNELIPAEEVVGGKLVHQEPESLYSLARMQIHAAWFLAAFMAGIPFLSLFPMTTAMASMLARKSPLKCLLVGFVTFFALPILALIGIQSIFGFPLGALILVAWGVMVYLSRIVMGLMIGTLILRSGATSVGRVLLSMLTGLAFIYIFTFIPSGIGVMVQLLVIWIGSGSLLLALIQKRRLIIQVPEELKQLETLKNEQNHPTEETQ